MIIFSGIIVGFCFDFYRIVRWRIGLNKVLTFIGDIIFSCIALAIIYTIAQKANYLELRFYLFGGCFLGLLIYLRFISSAYKKACNALINLFVNIILAFVGIIGTITQGIFRALTLLMRYPYEILRWVSMLLFRVSEAVGRDSWAKVKKRITKTPRQ